MDISTAQAVTMHNESLSDERAVNPPRPLDYAAATSCSLNKAFIKTDMDTINPHFIAVHYESLGDENRHHVLILISDPIFIKTKIDNVAEPFIAVHYASLKADTRG